MLVRFVSDPTGDPTGRSGVGLRGCKLREQIQSSIQTWRSRGGSVVAAHRLSLLSQPPPPPPPPSPSAHAAAERAPATPLARLGQAGHDTRPRRRGRPGHRLRRPRRPAPPTRRRGPAETDHFPPPPRPPPWHRAVAVPNGGCSAANAPIRSSSRMRFAVHRGRGGRPHVPSIIPSDPPVVPLPHPPSPSTPPVPAPSLHRLMPKIRTRSMTGSLATKTTPNAMPLAACQPHADAGVASTASTHSARTTATQNLRAGVCCQRRSS